MNSIGYCHMPIPIECSKSYQTIPPYTPLQLYKKVFGCFAGTKTLWEYPLHTFMLLIVLSSLPKVLLQTPMNQHNKFPLPSNNTSCFTKTMF